MVEYIDRNLIEWYGCNYENAACENRECSGCSHAECSHSQVMQIPPANVIERSKLDRAIEEMEKTENTQEHISYDGDINIKGAFNDGIEKALEILKRHIGE